MPFADLVQVSNIKLFSQDERLRRLLPAPTDLLYSLFGEDGEDTYRLVITPGTEDQLRQSVGVNPQHLAPDVRASGGSRVVPPLPHVGLFMDIDLYRAKDGISLGEVDPFADASREKAASLATRLCEYLFTENPEG